MAECPNCCPCCQRADTAERELEWRQVTGVLPSLEEAGTDQIVICLPQKYVAVFYWSTENERWEDVDGRAVDRADVDGWRPLLDLPESKVEA